MKIVLTLIVCLIVTGSAYSMNKKVSGRAQSKSKKQALLVQPIAPCVSRVDLERQLTQEQEKNKALVKRVCVAEELASNRFVMASTLMHKIMTQKNQIAQLQENTEQLLQHNKECEERILESIKNARAMWLALQESVYAQQHLQQQVQQLSGQKRKSKKHF